MDGGERTTAIGLAGLDSCNRFKYKYNGIGGVHMRQYSYLPMVTSAATDDQISIGSSLISTISLAPGLSTFKIN